MNEADVIFEPQRSLAHLFSLPLDIPDYQRTYSWKSSHVQDLLQDIFERENPYLMGTVILHDESSENCKTLSIVDGQQRLVTLTILLNVISGDLEGADKVTLPLLKGEFSSGAIEVILNTRKVIREFLGGKLPEQKWAFRNFLLSESGLLFSVLTLSGSNALDRAYTFFDSVNSKGKALTDFDLLKAHHLMFIPPKQEGLATRHNDEWQNHDASHPDVFSITLRRLRMWGRGQTRDSKQERPDFNEFCSLVEPDHEQGEEHRFNRYMQPSAFRSWRRDGDRIVLSMDFPLLETESLIPAEVTQSIEGGDAFFLYAKRYHGLYSMMFSDDKESISTSITFIRKLVKHIDNGHLQHAFRSVMLLYVDKFGEDRLIEVGVCAERIISAWRWAAKSLRLEGTLSHICENRIISILLESVSARHSFEQLYLIAQKCTLPEYITSGVRRQYLDRLKEFYIHENPKISDNRVKSLTQDYINK